MHIQKRLGGGAGDFVGGALVGGVLGSIGEDGRVEWGRLLDGVRVGYWELYR